MYHDGWYYLLATHGSCCRGADSGYNIRCGRSRKVTGPFLDAAGIDMIQGGGKLLIGAGGRVVGAGHFGLLDLGDGVQKFSLHWEADLDRGGVGESDRDECDDQDGEQRPGGLPSTGAAPACLIFDPFCGMTAGRWQART